MKCVSFIMKSNVANSGDLDSGIIPGAQENGVLSTLTKILKH